MDKDKLLEKLKEIEGTINDADISIPDNDIGTELSDVEYYDLLASQETNK